MQQFSHKTGKVKVYYMQLLQDPHSLHTDRSATQLQTTIFANRSDKTIAIAHQILIVWRLITFSLNIIIKPNFYHLCKIPTDFPEYNTGLL